MGRSRSQSLGRRRRRKDVKAGRKKRREVVELNRGRSLRILVIWESGVAVHPKHKLNTENEI